jgi:Domain of unknown function (DUF397)
MNMIAIPRFNNALWKKGSRSASTANCVEVATVNGLVGVRDSKNPTGHVIVVTAPEWINFLTIFQDSR